MQPFYIEGLVIRNKSSKRGRKSERSQEIEPFGQVFWAQTASDALRMASESLADGQWLEGPEVSPYTEEQRMHQIGAPLLPGFGSIKNKAGGAKPKKK
jgi:hypothetical protein